MTADGFGAGERFQAALGKGNLKWGGRLKEQFQTAFW